MMMASNEFRKVTKPDFRKKICVLIINLFVSELVVFGHFLEIASLDFARNSRNYRNYCEESPLKISGPEKICSQVSRCGEV